MLSELRACPVCGIVTHQYPLAEDRALALTTALGLHMAADGTGLLQAFWCLRCGFPYAVIWPEVETAEQAMRLAGFPPRGPRQ